MVVGSKAKNNMNISRKKFQLIVETEVIAGLSKHLFSFRIFSSVDLNNFSIEKNWNMYSESEKELKEDTYSKSGLTKIDFIFPRTHYELDKIKTKEDYIKWVNYFSIFQRPVETMPKNFYKKASYFKLYSLKPAYVNLYLRFMYFRKTSAPVVLEVLGPMSLFEIEAYTDLEEELELQVGKGSTNHGYGRVKLIPI